MGNPLFATKSIGLAVEGSRGHWRAQSETRSRASEFGDSGYRGDHRRRIFVLTGSAASLMLVRRSCSPMCSRE